LKNCETLLLLLLSSLSLQFALFEFIAFYSNFATFHKTDLIYKNLTFALSFFVFLLYLCIH